MRIPVGCKIPLSQSVEAAHTAVSSALDTDVLPKIFISHNHFQNLKRSMVFHSGINKVSCHCHILYFRRSLEALVFLCTGEKKTALFYLFFPQAPRKCRNSGKNRVKAFFCSCIAYDHPLFPEDLLTELCQDAHEPSLLLIKMIGNPTDSLVVLDTVCHILKTGRRRMIGHGPQHGGTMSRGEEFHLESRFEHLKNLLQPLLIA